MQLVSALGAEGDEMKLDQKTLDKGNQMDINSMTLSEMRQRLAEAEEIRQALNVPLSAVVADLDGDGHWKIGKLYFIRTVTHHLCGRLVAVGRYELVIEDAAWVADDGRFHETLATGNLDEHVEIEPFPDGPVIVGRGSLIDACVWAHPPLRVAK